MFYPSSSGGQVVIVADDDKTFTFTNAYSGRTNFFENRPIDPRPETVSAPTQPPTSGKRENSK